MWRTLDWDNVPFVGCVFSLVKLGLCFKQAKQTLVEKNSSIFKAHKSLNKVINHLTAVVYFFFHFEYIYKKLFNVITSRKWRRVRRVINKNSGEALWRWKKVNLGRWWRWHATEERELRLSDGVSWAPAGHGKLSSIKRPPQTRWRCSTWCGFPTAQYSYLQAQEPWNDSLYIQLNSCCHKNETRDPPI